jgi:hypothetical protein
MWTNTIFNNHSRADAAFFKEVDRLNKAISRRTADSAELATLRCNLVSSDWLRLPVEDGQMQADAQQAAAGGGGGGDPVDPATQERAERRATVAWLLACGTHPRSWSSPFRMFATTDGVDLLRWIVDLSAFENPAWIPRPQPAEVARLRKLNWRVELELQAERATSEELRLQNSELTREHARVCVSLQAEVNRLNTTLESEREERHSELAHHTAACEKEIKRFKAKVREVNKDWTDDSTEWQVSFALTPPCCELNIAHLTVAVSCL